MNDDATQIERRMSRSLVLACRGCCCGTDKHPNTDHRAQLDRLEAAGVEVRITPCLGPCRWSNVYVVADTGGDAGGERNGDGHGPSRRQWFGHVLTDARLDQVVAAARGRSVTDAAAGFTPTAAVRARTEQRISHARRRRQHRSR
ncbi:MAG: (2Fe-2S) ferredoxin domain-containing protein [Acidimicrobiales bacterium]